MAIRGNGSDYDISLNAGSSIQTSTSQYLVVGIEDTSTSVDATAYLSNAGAALSSTITARMALGINQTYMSSGSNEAAIRVQGISKAKCAAAVKAGAFVTAYEGASTTTFAGHVQAFAVGTVLTATSARVILGRALESGATNTVISVLLSPSIMPI